MSSTMVSTSLGARPLAASKESDGALLEMDGRTFRENFNRQAFIIRHNLSGHPLFELPRLIELSKRLPERYVAYSAGDLSVGEGLYQGPRNGLSVEETIRRIEECRSWMVLKFVESDPEYRQLLDGCLDEVERFSAPLAPNMGKREGFIFISSPRSVTPFHIDPEYNFLLQIRGRKKINIFDPSDRTVLPEEELEQFYSANSDDVNVRFKEEYLPRAKSFDISPGEGLHFPVTAPHWVENGDSVSVSFSVTFENPACERRSIIYTTNARLRRMGLRPSPVGRSAFRDALKFYGFRALRRASMVVPFGER